MTQLPDRPPSDWTQDITDGQVNYFADDQFKKEVIEYNRRYLYWDELKYRVSIPIDRGRPGR